MKQLRIPIYSYVNSMTIEDKTRELLTHNQGNAIIGDGDPPKAIVKYNFQGQHRLSVVSPDRPRHLKLDMINREVL